MLSRIVNLVKRPKSSMNICLISQEYPPDTNLGGIATYTQTLARELVKRGERVHVITRSLGNEYQTEDEGVFVHRVLLKPRQSVPNFAEKCSKLNITRIWHPILNFSQRVYEEVYEIHRKEPIDVIEAPDTCAQAFFVNKFIDGPKKVVRLHTPFFWVRHINNMPDSTEHLLRDELEKIQAEDATRLSSPTKVLANIVGQRWGLRNIDVIPYLFNLGNYLPDLTVYDKYLKGEDYILYFGRLESRKGVLVLAHALTEVLNKDQHIKVAFVGSDSVYNNASLKEIIQDILKNYRDRLIFIDNILHNSLYPVIERSKFVILPSLWDNLPFACMEAMSLGKVVIATTGSGFSEIIDDGINGVLCTPDDPDALSRSIIKCLDRKDLDNMGRMAALKLNNDYNEKIAVQVIDFYKNI